MKEPFLSWTDHEKTIVRRMTAAKYTAGEIAKTLKSRTRNAIIGFCRRNHIPLLSGNPAVIKRIIKVSTSRNAPRLLIKPRGVAYLPSSHVHPIKDASSGCAWLYGEPKDRNFCGKETTDGIWCCDHRRVVYGKSV